MKKLLLLLFIPFILSAQNWIPQGNGYTYTVTIKYGATTTATMDSVERVDFDMQYGDLAAIWVLGNPNSPVDSVYIKTGGKSILVAGVTPDDTIYGGNVTLKDSAGSIQNTIVNNSTGKRYWFFEPVIDVLEFGLLNHRGTLATREVTFVIKTKRTIIE